VEITLFYIPVGSHADAIALGDYAIEQKLAACANVFPIDSTFPWQGQLQHDKEIVLLLKTLPAFSESLRQLIRSRHAFEVPCIISWAVDVNDEYGKWVAQCLVKKT
jgi:periplasmic divalent cation tolerance protein